MRNILATPAEWKALPQPVREWLEIQEWRSVLPGPRELLVETFPRAAKYYLICYPFEGRLAHQTLGMLLTRRLERGGDGSYRINGARARLADVIEVLADANLGREMHSVISQGRVEEIVLHDLDNPTSRRDDGAGPRRTRWRRRR